jgi:hypothetical protein
MTRSWDELEQDASHEYVQAWLLDREPRTHRRWSVS